MRQRGRKSWHWLFLAAMVGGIGFSSTNLLGWEPNPLCGYSSGACYNTGCTSYCGSPRARCVVVHGLGPDQCSCECNWQE